MAPQVVRGGEFLDWTLTRQPGNEAIFAARLDKPGVRDQADHHPKLCGLRFRLPVMAHCEFIAGSGMGRGESAAFRATNHADFFFFTKASGDPVMCRVARLRETVPWL
jgi:hypothetical protein